jgi:hypothetical protein
MISTRLAWNEPVGRQRRVRIEEPKTEIAKRRNCLLDQRVALRQQVNARNL